MYSVSNKEEHKQTTPHCYASGFLVTKKVKIKKLLTCLDYKPVKFWASLPLTSVAQLVGHHPVNWKVAGLIPSQGTCLGCGFGPGWGHVLEATNWCFFLTPMFLSVSFSLPSSLWKIIKCVLRWGLKKNFWASQDEDGLISPNYLITL